MNTRKKSKDSRWSLSQVSQGSNAHRHTARRTARVDQVRIRMLRSAGLLEAWA